RRRTDGRGHGGARRPLRAPRADRNRGGRRARAPAPRQPAEDVTVWAPQRGPQTAFLATPADVAVYGGAAGGGKTYALLLELVRHHDVPGFTAVCFRRKTPQLLNPGGLWDAAGDILRDFRAHRRGIPHLDARFPSGAIVKFAHLEKEN